MLRLLQADGKMVLAGSFADASSGGNVAGMVTAETPTRICSLLPSATEIVAQLGLADCLVGVSAECRWPAEVVGKPVVTAARIDLSTLASAEIDRIVRDWTSDGRSLYGVEAELIERLAPELIITQDLCAVCAVSSDEVSSLCPVEADILSLDPRTLGDVAASVERLAHKLGVPERGHAIAAEMWSKIRAVDRAVAGAPRPRVFLAEWIDPPFCPGHWLPEMIELAGGTCLLGRPGEPSHPLDWQDVVDERPELVVIAPCGFHTEEAAARAVDLRLPCRTVAVDGDSCYSRPAPRLADGVCQLGHLLHPELVPDPGLPAIELAYRV
jgi:iron complex transport system substrate-binding protein